jgi:hypothetical protein
MALSLGLTEWQFGAARDAPTGGTMLLIVVILLVAYILVPLIDLVLNERVRLPVKIAVYAISFVWIVYVLFTGKMVV